MRLKYELSFGEWADPMTVFGGPALAFIGKASGDKHYLYPSTLFFYKQHFYMQHQAKISKKIGKNQATLWGWTFDEHVQKRSLSISEKLYDWL